MTRYTIRRQLGEDTPMVSEVNVLLPLVDVDVRLVDEVLAFVGEHLRGRQAYTLGRDHGGLRIEPMALQGLRVVDFCENRPCPWLGDGPNDYEPRTGSKTLFRVWAANEEIA